MQGKRLLNPSYRLADHHGPIFETQCNLGAILLVFGN